ncbi:hypothetical protein IV64_GL002795 [Lactiplantibacillus xiangfangensis]|uniref:Uncharacterized protein n=1 Tax=Lactiplantibacillus xiangfangensis TaxID=942150 RepID=A0A0R2MA40_9LACO|nr:hypothetical protein IV64_GL002795 [Lactiplantibacillus xiangfangensis]
MLSQLFQYLLDYLVTVSANAIFTGDNKEINIETVASTKKNNCLLFTLSPHT